MEQQLQKPVVRHAKRFKAYQTREGNFANAPLPSVVTKPAYKTYPVDSYMSHLMQKDKARLELMNRLFKHLLAPVGSKRNPL